MIRTERHRIRPSSPYYKMLRRFCHLAKNLYNHGNYLVRQELFKNGTWIRYQMLDSLLKRDLDHPDYRAMPTARSAQQLLGLLDKNWKSVFVAIKDWKKHPEKYNGRPKFPHYKRKDALSVLILTNQDCKIRDGILRFPRIFNGFTIQPQFIGNAEAKLKQVRIVPAGGSLTLEIVYEIPESAPLADNGRYAAIDIGVNNLAAVATNTEAGTFLVKGTPLKAMNQFYNKQLAKIRSICELMNAQRSSKRISRLTSKRNRKVDDYLHKASRQIVDLCAQHEISTIVIGKNNGWKQGVNLGKKNNQHFMQIPFARFIQMIRYKAETLGIKVILTEESYTSGTSFLDGEAPTKAFYNKARRVYRGLFVANNGKKINADINGAFQIMKKVFPNVNADGIEGVALRPAIVAPSMNACHGSGCT